MAIMLNVETAFGTKIGFARQDPFSSLRPNSRSRRAKRLKQSLSATGRRLLREKFLIEGARLLEEQEDILVLLDSSPEWALSKLHTQYRAIRTAADVLDLGRLGTVASRAEVLVCMLSQRLLTQTAVHAELLRESGRLLTTAIERIAADGHDERCEAVARTALCLFAAGEPATQEFAPLR